MKVNDLQHLFEHEIIDLYSAEQQIAQELPKMAAEASYPELRDALSKHLTETEEHIVRLDKIGDMLGFTVGGHVCMGVKGIIAEGELSLKMVTEPSTKDAAIILSTQKVEHYEISTYGSVAQFAQTMGDLDVVKLLETTLKEEKEADAVLTKIAEGSFFKPGVNVRSAADI